MLFHAILELQVVELKYEAWFDKYVDNVTILADIVTFLITLLSPC